MSKIILEIDYGDISSIKENALKLNCSIVSYKTNTYGWTARLCMLRSIDDAYVLSDINSFSSMKFAKTEIDAVRSVYIELLERNIRE